MRLVKLRPNETNKDLLAFVWVNATFNQHNKITESSGDKEILAIFVLWTLAISLNRLVVSLEPLMNPHFDPYATENWNWTMEKSCIGLTTG